MSDFCEAHLERTGQQVPAYRMGLCGPCFAGDPINPIELTGIGLVHSAEPSSSCAEEADAKVIRESEAILLLVSGKHAIAVEIGKRVKQGLVRSIYREALHRGIRVSVRQVGDCIVTRRRLEQPA